MSSHRIRRRRRGGFPWFRARVREALVDAARQRRPRGEVQIRMTLAQRAKRLGEGALPRLGEVEGKVLHNRILAEIAAARIHNCYVEPGDAEWHRELAAAARDVEYANRAACHVLLLVLFMRRTTISVCTRNLIDEHIDDKFAKLSAAIVVLDAFSLPRGGHGGRARLHLDPRLTVGGERRGDTDEQRDDH